MATNTTSETPRRIPEDHIDIPSLEERVESLERLATALADSEFDADAYRKVLVASVREDIYARLRNLVWIATTAVALGLTLLMNYTVSDRIASTIKTEQSAFIQLQKAAQREFIVYLMDRAEERGPAGLRRQPVRPNRDESSASYLRELANQPDAIGVFEAIAKGGTFRERALMISYADQSRDDRLTPILIDMATRFDIQQEIRDDAAMLLLHSLRPEVVGQVLQHLSDEYRRSGNLPYQVAATISLLNTDSELAADLMSKISKSPERQMRTSGLLFLLRNNHTISAEPQGDDYSQLWLEAKRIDTANRAPTLDSERAIAKLMDAMVKYEGGLPADEIRHFAYAQRSAVAEHFANRFLKHGLTRLFLQTHPPSEDVAATTDLQKLPEAREIIALFPSIDLAKARTFGELLSTAKEGLRDKRLEWDANSSKYLSSPQRSPLDIALTALHSGDASAIADAIRYDDVQVPPATWPHVRKLFPDFRHGAEATGTSADQMELAVWIEEMDSKLKWKTQEKMYRVE